MTDLARILTPVALMNAGSGSRYTVVRRRDTERFRVLTCGNLSDTFGLGQYPGDDSKLPEYVGEPREVPDRDGLSVVLVARGDRNIWNGIIETSDRSDNCTFAAFHSILDKMTEAKKQQSGCILSLPIEIPQRVVEFLATYKKVSQYLTEDEKIKMKRDFLASEKRFVKRMVADK